MGKDELLDKSRIIELAQEYTESSRKVPIGDTAESCRLYREYTERIPEPQRPIFFRECVRLAD